MEKSESSKKQYLSELYELVRSRREALVSSAAPGLASIEAYDQVDFIQIPGRENRANKKAKEYREKAGDTQTHACNVGDYELDNYVKEAARRAYDGLK